MFVYTLYYKYRNAKNFKNAFRLRCPTNLKIFISFLLVLPTTTMRQCSGCKTKHGTLAFSSVMSCGPCT